MGKKALFVVLELVGFYIWSVICWNVGRERSANEWQRKYHDMESVAIGAAIQEQRDGKYIVAGKLLLDGPKEAADKAVLWNTCQARFPFPGKESR